MVLSKSRVFWVSFTALSMIAACLSYTYLDKVYSLVNLTITTDRHEILADAQKLAEELQWNIADYQHVTSFESQDDLQCFVELEAGGKEAFVEMFQSGAYEPYHWHVRFFKEKQVVEMHAWFCPQGKRLGFAQKLSEQAHGAALTQEQAQKIVEQQINAWCPNFKAYHQIEYDCETRDTGRIDHNFTYERSDLAIGKGFYRFHAVVCGDVIAKFEPSVKIPDNFMRRYKEMRSANNLLASVGSFFFRSLYILFFGLIGLIFFYRRNYLLLRAATIAAACVAGGMFLRGLNEYPLWWTSYNTIQSSSTFMLMKFFEQVIVFLSLFSMIFAVLLVAEAAGRFVYKNHVQFFQICNWSTFGSYEIAQQVVCGYLMVPFMFAYVVAFGYVTKTYCGWWSPAGSLSDPNIVASCFPWLGAVTISLQAGFFEEVVCRALPIAMTAVLTKESKHKKFWFLSVFIVQALIFGACHANYPNQPFYARLIELILPSFGFGWMYLKFGLLPGIITHFTYDVIWFAMPIFVSNLFWSKVMVVALSGLPLWFVLAAFLYHKKWSILPERYYNKSFHALDYVPTPVQVRRIGEAIPARNCYFVVVLGLCGLIAWAITHKFLPDTQALLVSKAQGIEIARQTIADKFGTKLDASWTAVATTQDDCNTTQSRFIWQVYGKDIYNLAQGSYISGVNWLVRFVQFSGDVESRGEEYGVVISSCNLESHEARKPIAMCNGHVMKAIHVLPEHFTGADITQEQAQALVYAFIEKEYNLRADDLALISINSDKFDNRRDWTIIMQDTQIFRFGLGGQARIKIKVSGDQIAEFSRFIFVPEDWTRTDQEYCMNLSLVKAGLGFLMFIFIILGCMFGVAFIATSRLGVQMMRHKGLLIAVVSLLYACNSLILAIASFNTAEPFYDQLTRVSLGFVTQISYQALFGSIFLAIGAVGFIRGRTVSFMHSLGLSIAAALFIIGTSSWLHIYEPMLAPICGNYAPVAHWSSTLAFCGWYIKIFYLTLSSYIAMFVVVKALQNYLKHYQWAQVLCSILFCVAMEAMQGSSSVLWMFLHGIVIGLVLYAIYYLILKYDMTLLPLIFGACIICMILPELLYPSYVGASFDGFIAITLLIIISLFFYERAHQE